MPSTPPVIRETAIKPPAMPSRRFVSQKVQDRQVASASSLKAPCGWEILNFLAVHCLARPH
jgi:hypothetical protein